MSEFTAYTYYIALGSNLGDTYQNLQTAVNYIFEDIGATTKISKVYRSPALGFQGGEFRNAVLELKSTKAPEKVLEMLLAIETKMGRTRSSQEGYASRVLDLDILYCDNQIISTINLQLPHPEIPNRKFVLQPLMDIAAKLVHPVLNKTTNELLELTLDSSVLIKEEKELHNPFTIYPINDLSYLVIEGNIGAGKTSLSRQIAFEFGGKVILERFKDNPFLPKFYKDSSRYAFPLEMSFLADRYQQFLDDIRQFDLFSDFVIADYDIYKSLIFAEVTLQPEEFDLYKKLFNLMYKDVSRPDLYVYLYQNTERLLQNIKKRGRSYEQDIQSDYLKRIDKGYLEFIKSQRNHRNIKIIDVSELDFVERRADYLKLLKELV